MSSAASAGIGDGRCHGSGSRWRPNSSCSTASPRRAGAGSRCCTRSRHGTGRSRRISPATASSQSGGRRRSPPATPTSARSLGPRVRRRVLVGASPGIADPAERAARAAEDAAVAARIEAIGLEAFAREWGAQPLFAGMPRGIAEIAHADRMRNTAAGLAAALRGLGTGVMPPLCDRLGELTVPVELLVGERDEKFLAIAERMAAALTHARLHVVPGAGHAAHLEAPEVVAEIIAASGPAS